MTKEAKKIYEQIHEKFKTIELLKDVCTEIEVEENEKQIEELYSDINEMKTGICKHCQGEGQVIGAVNSKMIDISYVKCRFCKGSGVI